MGVRHGVKSASVRHVSGFVFAEQLSGRDNAIELREDGRYDVKWEISQQDAASLDDFLVAFVERHRDLFEDVRFFPGLLGSGAHHSGGKLYSRGSLYRRRRYDGCE